MRTSRNVIKRLVCSITTATGFLYLLSAVFTGSYLHSQVSIDQSVFIPKYESSQRFLPNTSIRILLWTPFFDDDTWTGFYGNMDPTCPYKCEFSRDKGKIKDSDVLLFNIRDLSSHDPLPEYRREEQLWVVHNLEPPYNTLPSPQDFPNVFNWTSFVRPDSDVPSNYGHAILQTNLRPGQPVVFMNKTLPGYRKWNTEKSHLAAWRVSNCFTQSNRETFAQNLQKYVPLDIYGACSDGKVCDDGCLLDIKDHVFYLAFESGVCRGYVTEKFRHALQWGLIPVTLGHRDTYNNIAPPGSYIHVDDFQSVQHLAEFMTKVFHNQTLYESFFKWREHYALVNDYWCRLCTKLHEWDGSRQVYSDIGAWFMQDTCLSSPGVLDRFRRLVFTLKSFLSPSSLKSS